MRGEITMIDKIEKHFLYVITRYNLFLINILIILFFVALYFITS
jgi:hypothetical protein